MTTPDADTYALRTAETAEVPALALPYLPPSPRHFRPRIGLIGAGGIASAHPDAYCKAGWKVAAICNRTRSNAAALAQVYAPDALVTDRCEDVLTDPSDDVVEITPHPAECLPLMEAALKAGKHNLGQQTVTLTTAIGRAQSDLAGTWFNDGFRGAMSALLVAIEDDTEPANGAAENLRSPALAAIESQRSGREVAVVSVTRLKV